MEPAVVYIQAVSTLPECSRLDLHNSTFIISRHILSTCRWHQCQSEPKKNPGQSDVKLDESRQAVWSLQHQWYEVQAAGVLLPLLAHRAPTCRRDSLTRVGLKAQVLFDQTTVPEEISRLRTLLTLQSKLKQKSTYQGCHCRQAELQAQYST